MRCTCAQAYDDASVSPVVRQTLLHWAYELGEADFKQAAAPPAAHPCCTLAAHPCCTLAALPCCTLAALPCCTLAAPFVAHAAAPPTLLHPLHLRCTPHLHCTLHPTAPFAPPTISLPRANLLLQLLLHYSTHHLTTLLSHCSRASLRLPLPAADCARRAPSASRRTAPPTCRGSS